MPSLDSGAADTSPLRPDGNTVNMLYRALKGAGLGTEGEMMQRAQEIGTLFASGKLDRSGERAFALSAKEAGIPPAEARAIWKGLQP